MKKIAATLSQNKIYFAGLMIVFLSGILFLVFKGKEAAFISLNSYHPFSLNVFFINYTFLGDGIFALFLIGFMFFYFKRNQCGLALLYSFLISGLAFQLIKNIANAAQGPKLYFEAGTYLNFMEGAIFSGSSDFPSGHTATAFAIATVLALMIKNKKWQLLIIPAAALVGYSRMYLAQHFLPDVIVGALLGSISGILAFYIVQSPVNFKILFKKMQRVSPEQGAPSIGMHTA